MTALKQSRNVKLRSKIVLLVVFRISESSTRRISCYPFLSYLKAFGPVVEELLAEENFLLCGMGKCAGGQ